MTEETLFELALNTPASDRPALLDRACAGDSGLPPRRIPAGGPRADGTGIGRGRRDHRTRFW